jgi:hypothetical protein
LSIAETVISMSKGLAGVRSMTPSRNQFLIVVAYCTPRQDIRVWLMGLQDRIAQQGKVAVTLHPAISPRGVSVLLRNSYRCYHAYRPQAGDKG